jgi:hypothetical protein
MKGEWSEEYLIKLHLPFTVASYRQTQRPRGTGLQDGLCGYTTVNGKEV